MAFHLFADINNFKKQTDQDEAFGVQTNTDYLLTSKHWFTSPNGLSDIFAICDGQVFVLPKSNFSGTYSHWTNTVNLVLLPSEQPPNNLPKIKYIIYRGIWRPSLINPQGEIIPNSDPHSNNLTQRIINSSSSDPDDSPLEKTLGIGRSIYLPNFGTDAPIDNVFYRDNGIYQLYSVRGGFTIGKVKSPGRLGIDIIFDSVNYNPTFEILRDGQHGLFENEFRVSYSLPTSDPRSIVETSNEKEVVKHFLDPCALYGSLTDSGDGFWARNSGEGETPTTFPDGTIMNIKNVTYYDNGTTNNAYEKILDKIFFNKNKIYIDIRNPENNSLNYSENFDDSFLIQINPAENTLYNNLNPMDYYREKWPIFAIDKDEFDSQINPFNSIAIALPDDKTAPFSENECSSDPCQPYILNAELGLYITFGTVISTSASRLRFGAGDISRFVPNYNRRVYPSAGAPPYPTNANYSTETLFRFGNFNSDTKKPISNYLRLNILKDLDHKNLDLETCQVIPDDPEQIGRKLLSYDYLDNIFTPFSMYIPNMLDPSDQNPDPDPTTLTMNVYYEPHYIDNTMIASSPFIGYKGIAEHQDGTITLFAYATALPGLTSGNMDAPFALSGGSVGVNNTGTFLQYIRDIYGAAALTYLGVNLNIPTDGGTFFSEILTDPAIPPSVPGNPIGTPSPNNLVWISISKTDFETLRQINNDEIKPPGDSVFAEFIDPSRTFLGVEIVDSGTADDASPGSTLTDIPYIKYELFLRGEAYFSAPSPHTKIKTVSAGMFFYSIRSLGTILPSSSGVAPVVFFPRLVVDNPPRISGRSYSVIPDGSNKFSICTRILMARGNNVTESPQYCEYLSYFIKNIRQAWTNNPQKNEDCDNPGKYYLNNGISSLWEIDADNVHVVPAPSRAITNLRNNEVLFVLYNDPNGRAFVSTTGGMGTVGIMYFDRGSAPPLRYQEFPPPRPLITPEIIDQYTPAHEFGHVLGLADRYTYVGRVSSDNIIDSMYRPGTKTAYLQPSALFDNEFINNYNWIHNLYTDAREVPQFLDNTPIVAPEPAYTGGMMNSFLKRNPDDDNNPYYYDIGSFITDIQIQIISNPTMNEWLFVASNPLAARYLVASGFIFFLEQPDIFNGTYVGNNYAGDLSIVSIESDHDFVFTGALSDAQMESRRNIPSSFIAAFSPSTSPPGGGDFFRNLPALQNNIDGLMDDVKFGGLLTLINLITRYVTKTNLEADPTFVGWGISINEIDSINYIDISTMDFYRNYGEAWGRGRDIWNKNFETINADPVISAGGDTYIITHGRFTNREVLIALMT